jgi:hypothetical protein
MKAKATNTVVFGELYDGMSFIIDFISAKIRKYLAGQAIDKKNCPEAGQFRNLN